MGTSVSRLVADLARVRLGRKRPESDANSAAQLVTTLDPSRRSLGTAADLMSCSIGIL